MGEYEENEPLEEEDAEEEEESQIT